MPLARVLLALSAAGFAAAVPVPGQEGPPRPDPAEVVRRAEKADLVEVLRLGRQLGEAAQESAALREETARAVEGASERARLALGRALADAGEAAQAKDAILPLLQSPEEDAAEAAALLLGGHAFAGDAKVGSEISTALRERLSGGELPARVRLAAASTLFRLGSGADRDRARRELRAFLRSEDEDLRARAAFALAEIEDMESARSELKRLADEPTIRGRLARTYLDREEDARYYDRNLSRIREYYERSGAAPERPGDLKDPAILRDVMRAAQSWHIRGSLYTQEELVAAAARGMLQMLDPHSTFFTGEEYKRFVFDINPEYGGIGAFVRTIHNVFTIVRPIYSGPAYDAGLRSDDKVLAVDGWETANEAEDEIIRRLKGKPDTPVVVRIWRQGWQEPKEIRIVRAEIQVPVLHHELFPGGIGYVELVHFATNAAAEIDGAVRDLRSRGARALVFDLRNNQGGLLQAAVEVTSHFLPPGKLVVTTESTREAKESLPTQGRPSVPEDVPVVVLVNARSASASEIVAGALQDHGRAVVVGEPTYGKGSVQQLLPHPTLPDEPFTDQNGNRRFDEWEPYDDTVIPNGKYDFGPRLKLTVARYFLPNGRSIHTETDKEGRVTQRGGIAPDVEVAFQRVEGWKEEELDRLLRADAFKKYVDEHFEANRTLFVRLAEGDGGEWSAYPDFESFYASLETPLDRTEIRRWLRVKIRDRVADDRKKVFPGYLFLGDYQEDVQLQRAMRLLLERLGTDIATIPEYKFLLARAGEAENPPRPVEGTPR